VPPVPHPEPSTTTVPKPVPVPEPEPETETEPAAPQPQPEPERDNAEASAKAEEEAKKKAEEEAKKKAEEAKKQAEEEAKKKAEEAKKKAEEEAAAAAEAEKKLAEEEAARRAALEARLKAEEEAAAADAAAEARPWWEAELPLSPPVVRKEIRRMSRDEQERYANAVAKMMESVDGVPGSSQYFRLACYHGGPKNELWNAVGEFCVHRNEAFPGWHRAYLMDFERVMRCADMALGGDGMIGLPYWGWDEPEVNDEAPTPTSNSLEHRSVLHWTSVPFLRADRRNSFAGAGIPKDRTRPLRCISKGPVPGGSVRAIQSAGRGRRWTRSPI
jgi:hypothetical protein